MIALFLASTWIPNRTLVLFSIQSDLISFWNLMVQSPAIFFSNTSVFGAAFTLLVIVLSGLNMAMLLYYLRRKIILEKNAGTGVVGIVVGLMGVGCVSCGSVILSSVIGFAATARIIGVLPFGGLEFGVVGILLLLFSIIQLSKKIINPAVCRIN